MTSLSLDIRTIIFVTAVVQVLYAIGLFIISRTWIKSVVLTMVAIAFACGSAGGFLIAYRSEISPFLSIVVANVFVLSNPVLLYEALCHLLRTRTKARIVGPALVLLIVPILFYATFAEPDLRVRIIVMSLFFGAQTFFCAQLLMTKMDKRLIRPALLVVLVFVFATLMMTLRIILTLFQPDRMGFMVSGFSQSILQMNHLVYLTGIAFGFIWLHTQKMGQGLTAALCDVETSLQDQFSFVDVISHELKTPLATIQNSTESLLLRSGQIDLAQSKAFDRIDRALARLNNFIDVGLTQRWLDPEQIRSKIGPISIVELIQTAAEICKGRFPDHRVLIRCNASWSARDEVPADYNSLLTALKNVLENGMKFSPKQKNILVELGRDGDMLTLTVRDRGCGIAHTDKERVFEKYFRADNVGTTPGSGIGLFMVRHIIEAHEGTLTLRNRKSGGCRVDICLPLHTDVHGTENRIH